jgi:uncharacterized OB-fold protein
VDPPDFDWAPVSGDGVLKTWTVVRDAFLPAFADDTPYVIAEIELPEQEGLRLITQLVGIDLAELALGLSLEVTFDERAEGISVPQFKRAVS